MDELQQILALYNTFDPMRQAGQAAGLQEQLLRNQLLEPQAQMAPELAQVDRVNRVGQAAQNIGYLQNIYRANPEDPTFMALQQLLDQLLNVQRPQPMGIEQFNQGATSGGLDRLLSQAGY